MKKTFTFLIVTLICFSAFADSGGPDDWGYTWKDSNEPGGPAYNWIDILQYNNATEVKLLSDDNLRGPFTINFDFHYYWYDVNQFWVGSNGYIKFNELGQLAAAFPSIPSTAIPNDYLGVYLNDLVFATAGDTGKCWYWINPTLDTLIVSWIGVPYWSASYPYYTGSNTFQVILSKVDSSITFQYKDRSGTSATCTSVGFENSNGDIGLQVIPICNEPPQQYAIKITPPANPTLQVVDVEPYWVDNPGSGGIFLAQSSSSTYPVKVQVKNGGNMKTDPFPLYLEVKDPNNTVVVSDTVYTDTLQAQETKDITFFQEITPATAGAYKIKVTCADTSDNLNANDKKKWEVEVVDTTQSEIRLAWNDGTTNLVSTVNWGGVGGGAGMYFIPPFYPVEITKIHYNISFSASVPMTVRVWDDDGIGGLPYTMFDSIYVDGPSIIDGWNDFTLTTPIVINSGGFYLSWNMLGEGQTLLASTKDPISRRSYEVFNAAFSTYRFGEDQDPMMDATIQAYSFPTGTNTNLQQGIKSAWNPNPASDNAYAIFEVNNHNENVWLRIYNLSGQLLIEQNLGTHPAGVQQAEVDISDLAAGMYMTEINCGGEKKLDKLVVTK